MREQAEPAKGSWSPLCSFLQFLPPGSPLGPSDTLAIGMYNPNESFPPQVVFGYVFIAAVERQCGTDENVDFWDKRED